MNFVASPAPNIAVVCWQATEPGSPERRLGDAGRDAEVRRAMREAIVELAAARGKP